MTTKKPSGAQYKKIRRANEDQAQRDELARRAANSSAELAAHLKHFEKVGPPPLHPLEGTAWASVLAQALCWEIATDPVIDANTRRKQLSDLIKSLGTTHQKARIEELFKELREGLDKRDQERRAAAASAAPDGSPIQRPPAARRWPNEP